VTLKRNWFVSLAVLALGAATVVTVMALRSNNDDLTTIETARVARRDIGSTVLATGIIKPMVGAEVKVGSRISGVVKGLRANIGDYVKAGQIIAELEDSELQARVNQNLAAVEKARADLEYAKTAYGRDHSLSEKALISQQQIDQSETSLKVSEALLKQAEANLEYARVQLSYAIIYSPISGVIASVSTQEGEAVSASLAAPTFVSIIDLTRLEVQVFVDETDIGKIQVGQEARFTVDTYADSDFKGTVTAIYPKAVIQDNVVNYVVTLTITDFQEKTLRPEMTTNVTIRLETRKNVLAVPTNAILREQGERYVTVMDNGRTAQRKVKAGWKDDGFTEIVSGLEEGETITITPTAQENK
jgi:macrolide-specific efflux system membrane fusion protein